MAERWVSLGRKYCDICKVWFGDNKASIEHHERGEKHKNALAAKLRDVSRQREKKLQAEITNQGMLAAMEQGAFLQAKKYGDSVQEGPALPNTGVVQMSYFDPRQHTDVTSMAREMAKITDEKRNGEYRRPDGPSGPVPIKVNREAYAKAQKHAQLLSEHKAKKKAKLEMALNEKRAEAQALAEARAKEKRWVQGVTEEGETYYWHMYTGENAWEPPGPFYTPVEYDIFLATLDAEKEIKHNFDLAEIEQRQTQEEIEQGELPAGYSGHFTQAADPSEYLLDVPQHQQYEKKKKNRAPKRAHQPMIPENFSVGSAVAFVKPAICTRMNEVEDVNTIPLPSVEPSASSSSTVKEEEPEEVKPTVFQYAPVEPEPVKVVSETTGIGGWTRVVKKVESEPVFSPLTARYRELEEQEKKEAAEIAAGKKVEVKEEVIEFTEKVAAVKKVKGVVEFKKRSAGAKNVRKRED